MMMPAFQIANIAILLVIGEATIQPPVEGWRLDLCSWLLGLLSGL